jgi:hypothetical protein
MGEIGSRNEIDEGFYILRVLGGKQQTLQVDNEKALDPPKTAAITQEDVPSSK